MKICCDIDGVLADVRPFVEEYLIEKNDWNEYFKHTEEFKPIPAIKTLLHSLRFFDYNEVVLVTGRPESNRKQTANWARDCLGLLPNYRLHMRKDGDFRHTHEIKMEWFRELKPDLIIDDDPLVVEAATKEGFIVLQVHGFRITDNDMTPHFSERSK